MIKIVVFTGHSLLAQGIVSRLRRSSHQFDVQVVDFNRSDAIETLVELQPRIVIIESQEFSHSRLYSLNGLFSALPNLVVMEVSLEDSRVQMIQSGQYDASSFSDFLSILENASAGMPGLLLP